MYRADVGLVSGDIADMPLELCHCAPPEEVWAQHKLLDKVLEDITPLADKVYYIPGNVSYYPYKCSCHFFKTSIALATIRTNILSGACHNLFNAAY